MPKREGRSEDSYIFHDILPAFADYNYPTVGDKENLKIKGDVKIKIGSSYKEPDLVFYTEGIPVLLVESKKEGKSVKEAGEQAKSYIRNFPIKEYSRDGRPPQYAAVTVGQKIFFYKYERDINEYGGIIDSLEPISHVPTYEELRRWYGLEEKRKPSLTPRVFKSIFYQLILALDTENKNKITPEVVLKTTQLLFEFLKDKEHYTSRFPYTEVDGHLDRQRWIRSLLRQYDWSNLNEDIASQFRREILRAFQGSDLNQYITPWEVIVFMVNLAEIKPNDKVLDFECGSGGYIAAVLKRGVLLKNIKGIDIADLPYLTSKVYLAFYFNIQGEEIEDIPIANDNGLYLIDDDWDVIIGNPAGGDKYDPEGKLGDLEKVYGNLERDLDQNGRDDPIWEYNFSIQQAVRSAKTGGRICLVLPEGFFSNSSAEFLRRYVAKHCKVKAIISLPRGIFYKGTTARSAESGRQIAQMKMSILLAEKTKKVINGEGIELSLSDLDYPIFLTAVQKPADPQEVPGWFGQISEKVLKNYQEWRNSGELAKDEEVIKFIKARGKKTTALRLPFDEKKEIKKRGQHQTKKKVRGKQKNY